MQFNVAQLLKEGVGARRSYLVEGETTIPGVLDGRTPVWGQIEVLRVDRGALVIGDFSMRLRATCSRCLDLFEMTITWHMEEEFFASVDIDTGAPLPAPEDASAFTLSARHELDLTEAVRQYAALAVPMKPLCRADCAGLCPVCGQKLNGGACSCAVQPEDPRWAKLAALRNGGSQPTL